MQLSHSALSCEPGWADAAWEALHWPRHGMLGQPSLHLAHWCSLAPGAALHSPRTGEGRFLPWLLGHRRLKARRMAHLSARAGHLIPLWSWGCWGAASTMLHIFPQAGPCSSAPRASWDPLPGAARTTATAHSHQCLYWVRKHTASPASPASGKGVRSFSGPGAQLVRVMSASTTFPMCSRRLRSAAAREISISVICRERAAAPAAAAEQHSGGRPAPTPQAGAR